MALGGGGVILEMSESDEVSVDESAAIEQCDMMSLPGKKLSNAATPSVYIERAGLQEGITT